jgi:hypothetical protein
MNMVSNIEIGKHLVDELADLWIETKVKCDKIESLIKQHKETNIKP